MNLFKYIWGMLFRLFPCPVPVGLRRIGKPDQNSPVLVTCNFYITVRRIVRALKGYDFWLLVADSKGVNVWCAAGAEEFNTHCVVSAIKTSGIEEEVAHRRIILPPLGAPGIKADEVKKQTGWSVKWGPVRLNDIPRYLDNNQRRTEPMKRVTFTWRERIDTALGSLFPFYFLGAVGFMIFGPHLLADYLLIGALTFLFFYLACPWLPGKIGLIKALILDFILGIILAGVIIFNVHHPLSIRADLIIAMVMLTVYATELGGIASNLPSDLDPVLARLGLKNIGNIAFAGTIRTELLNNIRVLSLNRVLCVGCRSCEEVCPQGVWEIDGDKRAVLAHKEACTACRACLVQCRGGAITAEFAV